MDVTAPRRRYRWTMSQEPLPPSHILPADGRFGAGPSRIRAAQMHALCAAQEMGTSHRKAPVKARVASIKDGLRELFSIPAGYEIAFGVGGATVFWSVATVSLVETSAKAAVFGEFGAKFAADIAAAPWTSITETIAPAGELAVVEDSSAEADTYVYPQNETSTGVASPLYRGAPGALTLVDATSIAGATPVDWEVVDAYYFSPQKCFGSEGGLWTAVLSPAAQERAERLTQSKSRFVPASLNLSSALKQSKANQTVNTPALATLILFDEQVQWMLGEGGLPAMTERTRAGSGLVQAWAQERPFASLFVEDPAWRSPVITTVDFDASVPVLKIAEELRKVGIVDIEGYRKLGRNQLRIPSFPSIPPEDIAALLATLDWMIERELR